MTYLLLEKFQSLFAGQAYKHRNSTLGDSVALMLYEDLLALGRSKKYVGNVSSGRCVVNAQNRRVGIKARRGDGTFGEIVPHVPPKPEAGYAVPRGPTATIEVGIEVKILSKGMIKQIDRVIGDLKTQVQHFKSRGGKPICVGVVGINRAAYTIGLEGDRSYRTDGKKHKHPIQEAAEAESRLIAQAAPAFDEFLVLRFEATNEDPFVFSWVNHKRDMLDYGAILARVSAEYEARF